MFAFTGLGVERFLRTPLSFHLDAEARLVTREWRQQMRQQLIATELADNPGRRRLCPTVVLFEVTPCPSVFGGDMDHVVSVHVDISVVVTLKFPKS